MSKAKRDLAKAIEAIWRERYGTKPRGQLHHASFLFDMVESADGTIQSDSAYIESTMV